MAGISAALIKQVRDRTSAGLMKCRKALQESDGTVDGAIEWLRKQGVKGSVAARSTSEGVIAIKNADNTIGLLELQCETDFAARNESFGELVGKLLDAGINGKAGDVEALNAIEIDGISVEQTIKVAINTIGENLRLKRFKTRSLDGNGGIGTYSHATTNKLSVAVAVKAGNADTAGKPEFQALLKQLAMHVAGAPIPPLGLVRDDIDSAVVEKERSMILEEMNANPKDSKKPDNIKEKIVDGKMNRFFSERILPEQKFVMDDKKSIQQVIADAAKELGDTLEIAWFERWALGA